MKFKCIVASLSAGLFCAAAVAGTPEAGRTPFSFSSFGTFGVAHSSEKNADFTSSPLRLGGAGATRSWSPEVDSRVAGQITFIPTDRMSAVVQMVAERRNNGTYVPTVEWANLAYRIAPAVDMRVGRIALPILLAADHRKVGYTLPWVRPPVEVYGLVPFSNSDGLDLTFRSRHAALTSTLKASYGRTDVELDEDDNDLKVRDLWALTHTSDIGDLTMRATFLSANLTVDAMRPFFDAYRLFGAQGNALADKYEIRNKRSNVLAVGLNYDPGNWFVMTEWSHSRTRSVLGNLNAWYASGGYRLGSLTPYLTYSRVSTVSNKSEPGLNTTGMPPDEAAAAGALNARLNAGLGAAPGQSTISIGGRWDFMKNAAFKLQYDRINLDPGSSGTLNNIRPGFAGGGKVHVVSTAVDFAF